MQCTAFLKGRVYVNEVKPAGQCMQKLSTMDFFHGMQMCICETVLHLEALLNITQGFPYVVKCRLS